MAIDLKNLKRTKVSRDLKNKFVFFYGSPKIGKTTLATKFPKNLLLAFEHGYNLIDDIAAVDIPTWGEFKKYVKQLVNDEDLKAEYNSITIDTISLAYDRCETYICDRENVDKIGEVNYGAGYKMVDKEFSDELNKLTQAGYGLVFIGHEKARVDTDGQISVKHIVPDLPDRCAKIVNRMVDLTAYIGMENQVRYIYPRQLTYEEGKQVTEIYAGSRFANLNDKIDLDYDSLVNAISEAMKTDGAGKTIALVDAPVSVQQDVKIDYKEVKSSIAKIAKRLNKLDEDMGTSQYMEDYREITEKFLGKGKLVRDCGSAQAEHLQGVLEELQLYLKSNKIEVE